MSAPHSEPAERSVSYQLGAIHSELATNTRETHQLREKLDTVATNVDRLLQAEKRRVWWTRLAIGTTAASVGTALKMWYSAVVTGGRPHP